MINSISSPTLSSRRSGGGAENLENPEVTTGLEKMSFHSNPKERQCQRMLKLLHNCTHLTCGSEVKASACNMGDLDSIPGLGRSPGEGNGNPLHYSCLENPMDGGAWQATVHAVAKSRTRLSDFTSHTSKVILKILQARLQEFVNHELPDAQARFCKGRGTRDQIANICWIIKKS